MLVPVAAGNARVTHVVGAGFGLADDPVADSSDVSSMSAAPDATSTRLDVLRRFIAKASRFVRYQDGLRRLALPSCPGNAKD